MSNYRHIFFDLDHTLWDFRSNSRDTLTELFQEERLEERGIPSASDLIEAYEEVNQVLWGRYEQGHIPKEVLRVLRFRNSLLRFGVKEETLAVRMGRQYVERCPLRTKLMPGVPALLDDLSRDHVLHIITNGFDEVQRVKLQHSGIGERFHVILTSEKAGARKPDPRIFARAMKDAGARDGECLMVGDHPEADMAGARRAGWDQVHFAAETEPDPLATYRIMHMDELRPILL
jgi:putative hydrolase of the HAD superfamily